MADYVTFAEGLTLLAQAAGVGAVIAFLFERVVWFQNLQPQAKWWVILGLSLALPLAAQLIVQLVPVEYLAMVEPYWQALRMGFLAWAGTQGTHKIFNKYLESAAG